MFIKEWSQLQKIMKSNFYCRKNMRHLLVFNSIFVLRIRILLWKQIFNANSRSTQLAWYGNILEIQQMFFICLDVFLSPGFEALRNILTSNEARYTFMKVATILSTVFRRLLVSSKRNAVLLRVFFQFKSAKCLDGTLLDK